MFFGETLKQLTDYESINQKLKKNKASIQITGMMDTGMVHFINTLSNGFKYRIIVSFDAIKAKEIFEDYKCFDDNVILHTSKDFIFYNADAHGTLLVKERMNMIKAILESKELTIVTTIDGLMNKMISLNQYKKHILEFKEGENLNIEKLKEDLVALGYERVTNVEEPGQFAVRGSIIDIFNLTDEVPVRIDLWDDEIDMIKNFDPMSQRAVSRLDSIKIYPASELIIDKERLEKGINSIKTEAKKTEAKFRKDIKNEEAHRISTYTKEIVEQINISTSNISLDSYINYFYDETFSLLDYFNPDETIIYIDEPKRNTNKAEAVTREYEESMVSRLEKGYMMAKQTEIIFSYKNIYSKIQNFRNISLTTLDQKINEFDIEENYHITAKNINPYNNSFETLVKDLIHYKKNNYSMLILAASRTRAIRIAKDLLDYDLKAYYTEDTKKEIMQGEIAVAYGNIHKGFEYPLVKYVVISESDIFGGEKKKKPRKKQYTGEKIVDFNDLSIGDCVVHENHGLGIYKGIENVDVDGISKDFLKIEYADGGNLYVPATGFDKVQKYSGADARPPKLNKLGGMEWSRAKSKVKGAVEVVAKDLVELYAKRQDKKGFVYSQDTVWQKEFEEMFPYEETQDQINAIEDIKNDMETPKIMDRLICGDVGYGKTEVAIRAAFKAVQDGKQVAILAPTTILAQQHYNTFTQRFKDFPIKIDLLCRFRTPAQAKNTIKDLKKGFVDVLIGTHRILSKDVEYKDLGMLIVDEEQRFGVRHKEKIKQYKEEIDVLTLSATPIPRTLHMSLVGIRDMSVLEEPPVDRLPIQTFVMEYNDETVREAINRELARNGQVYYVYNRVNNIEEICLNVQKLVPNANVAYAHGQMSERKLEQIMYDFINGEIDVLVSTTIIETGMDISNANTMIIHDADTLGLSQMYQLRGRVGRSTRTSYAFLMYKRDKMLKEVAEKRLSAIKEFTDLGAGFKIAMKDLEIRGAGNLLGTSQHGHMSLVGYDLYCKMLNQEVLRLKGEKVSEDFETRIDLAIDAYIPGSYIPNETTKLDVYKKISVIETLDEKMDMEDELADRFGDIPLEVINLLQVVLIKAAAHNIDITDVTGNKKKIKMILKKDANVDLKEIEKLLIENRKTIKFVPEVCPYFLYMPKTVIADNLLFLEDLYNIVKGMETIKNEK